MKVGISRFVVAAAIAALVVVGGSTPMFGQISFTDFSTPTNLTVNGNAAVPVTNTNGLKVLRLTPAMPFQSGSAWFNTQQATVGTFSTTFTFQLSGSTTLPTPGDGFAFLIQTSPAGTAALDPDVNGTDGCSLGFGDAPLGSCTGQSGGITNSLAVEFDTYENDDIGDINANHVLIQSCGTGANSVDATTCFKAGNYNLLDAHGNTIKLADGNPHTATISFAPSGNCSNAGCPGTLDVILDSNDLFPSGGVAIDMTAINSAPSTTAYVGFTAATGGANNNQDILSWTFTPQQQTTLVTPAGSTVSFPNANGNVVYSYTAALTSGSPQAIGIQPKLTTQSACDALIHAGGFPGAHCFVFDDAEGTNVNASVMFEVTCPQAPNQTCASNSLFPLFAELGSVFNFVKNENPFFVYPGILGPLNPFPGWLKGEGGTPGDACTAIPNAPPIKFTNQVDTFFIDGGTIHGKSGGGSSCYIAAYDTPGEVPPGISITTPAFTTYTQNQVVNATYTCKTPTTSKDPSVITNLIGPYLTVQSCSQNQAPNNNTHATCSAPSFGGGISCTNGVVDTTALGLHAFLVTAIDTGGNQNAQAVVYNVVKPKGH